MVGQQGSRGGSEGTGNHPATAEQAHAAHDSGRAPPSTVDILDDLVIEDEDGDQSPGSESLAAKSERRAAEAIQIERDAAMAKTSCLVKADQRLQLQLLLPECQAAENKIEAQRPTCDMEEVMVKVALQAQELTDLQLKVGALETDKELADGAVAVWQRELWESAQEIERLKGIVQAESSKQVHGGAGTQLSAEGGQDSDSQAKEQQEQMTYVEQCDMLVRCVSHETPYFPCSTKLLTSTCASHHPATSHL